MRKQFIYLSALALVWAIGISRAEEVVEEECPTCEWCDDKPPQTLFDWAIGPDDEEEEEEEETTKADEPLVTDRPDFTEASTTVGRGLTQIEVGYTFFYDKADGSIFRGHSYPEFLIRIGMFADWFELRIVQNYVHEIEEELRLDGANDLDIGCKLALTEQKGYLPEMALILSSTVPTGHDDFTNDEMLPGFNLLYSWELADWVTMAGSTLGFRARDDLGHFYLEMGHSITFAYTLTEKFGAYTEWFVLYPVSAIAPDTVPLPFFNGGFTYLVNNNLQLDIRAGVGLNDHAEDFFAGAGFAYRF